MARIRALHIAALAAPLAALAAPALAQASLAMLDSLDRGGWEVRYRDGSSAQKVCVRTGRELIQLRHKDSGCNRFVVEDEARDVTVQYTCRGNGYGRTHIRKESSGLVQIDSQGIAGGKPFQFTAEARQTGSCG
ncbi:MULTISPECIES: hypothetical protein [unclassified Erythrobacter]|uniref:hypothetical protein n=1 Tax=Erythrobacteraceae TaxID=335929 RepID=UPI00076C8D77|nr:MULTISPECIES: hypothetical protein [unclassified Erythrobacter]KWV94716.1 hypothetical protein ASS64_05735 [Erythrobacter sp. AP23]MBO6527198.1 hypothetical protein [Erythrobacter sp.]MBO6531438.1 hypothetical protein [Erythrobacter sp.]MBO6767079.1 hypothetical protein [Erythrobacter sp.]